MPLVHFPPEIFDEKPWLGVLLGAVCIVLFAGIVYSTTADSIRYSQQQTPEILDLARTNIEFSKTRRWVTLINFRLNCEIVMQVKRTEIPDAWILGPVASTYTLISGLSGEILMIVKFDGDVVCSDVQNGPLTGILTNTGDLLYGGVPEKFGKTIRPVLYVGQGLQQSLLLLITAAFLILLGFYEVGSSGKKWAEKSSSRH